MERATHTCDKNGRAWLRLDEAQAGQVVELDDGFDCRCGGKAFLHDNEGDLFFYCDNGKHSITGQADDGVHCVGIYTCEP